MKTLAEQSKDIEADSGKLWKKQSLQSDAATLLPVSLPLSNLQIQRKADCACGGDCPACTAKSANLPVSHPFDSSEIEADLMADEVMRMSDGESSSPKQNQSQFLSMSGAPFVQTKSKGGSSAGNEAGGKITSSTGGGSALDSGTQSFMQSRFGADFSGVKIHTGSEAVKMNRELNAEAFTLGGDIYFDEGKYQPESSVGKRLLAHELTHVLQQTGSPALAMKRQLQKKERMIQRSVNTWGGQWFDDTFTIKTIGDRRSVKMDMRFKPGTVVNAELIGLTQTVRSYKNKKAYYINNDATVKGHSIQSGGAIVLDPATRETDEGAHIDQADYNRNPLYAAEGAPATDTELSDTLPVAGDVTQRNTWGRHGFKFVDASKVQKDQDAELHDETGLNDASKDSGQVFETTALAIKGTQRGTYYGSVQWGWRTDGTGNFDKIPFKALSQGVPSSTFMKAAEIWNAAKTSTGRDTLDLPTVDVKITTALITGVYPVGFVGPPLSIPAGTRVQIIRNAVPPTINGLILVVDGAYTGTRLEVTPADMINLRDERA